MGEKIAARLKELGIDLPPAVAPVADYIPCVQVGDCVYVSGQIPLGADGKMITGCLSADDHAPMPAPDGSALAQAVQAARLCAINILAQLQSHLGTLDRVERVVKLTGFVSSDASFTQHPEVVNGASSLMVSVFGETGRHARAAVGVSSLPRGVMVEVEGVFCVR